MTGLISGISSLAGTVIGGNKAKKASKKATAAEVEAQNRAIGVNDANTAAVTGLYDPYEEVGTAALPELLKSLASGDLTRPFNATDFEEDPGYQFRVAEGEKAINRGANARGQYFAPATIKGLSTFAGGEASKEYDSAYSRFSQNQSNMYNRLLGLATFGKGAVDDSAAALTRGADTNIKSILGIGDAQQAGLRERGAITAKQWTEGSKAAGKIATSLAGMI